MRAATVMVVDDDVGLQLWLKEFLQDEGCRVLQAFDEAQAVEVAATSDPSVVLLDLVLPGSDGLSALDRLRRVTEAPIVVITGYGTIQLAVEAMRRGASDFLTKPIPPETLPFIIRKAIEGHRLRLENQRLREEVHRRYGLDRLVGSSPAMQAVFERIRAVAPTDTTAFITGETGTGKELVARAIHQLSGRRQGPFVAINCAAISGELFESELFGHERGAFTGASTQRKGLFERAHGGTVLLDEVTLLSGGHQGKLLRILQDRTVVRVGGTAAIPLDLRVLAATNQEVERLVPDGRFREDLYYRLVVFPIHLPPLRDRMEDLSLLVQQCLGELSERMRRPVPRVSPEAMRSMMAYAWPGNVRQLFNVIERAFVTATQEGITRVEVPIGGIAASRPAGSEADGGVSLGEFLEAKERGYWTSLLARAGGHLGRAARLSGVSYPTLRRRLRHLDVRARRPPTGRSADGE